MSQRSIYDHDQLRHLFDPASVAVVGASENKTSFGARTLENLAGYSGQVWPVNAKYGSIGGRTCYPDLSALPSPPDCVIAAVPRDAVEAVVAEAVAVGAGGVIIYASGFAETGMVEREALQRRLALLVAGTRTRVLGPNCLGVLTARSSLGATFTFVPHPPKASARPGIGLVSQSGALGAALLQAGARGVPFSHMFAPGNSVDVDVSDMISYLAEDDSCSVVACIFEGTSSPIRLLQAAEVARRRGKPVLVCKIAAGEEGAAAAMSHTGSLAGSSAAYDALFDKAGFVVVERFEALIETANFFRKAPAYRGRGAAVISPSGGAGILCADWAERMGVPLPQPSGKASAILQSVIPEFGSARNPCDVTAQVINDPKSLAQCASAMLADPGLGALVVPHITAYPEATLRTLDIGAAARAAGAAYCVVWMSEWLEGPGAAEMEEDPTTAVFRSAERCFRTLASWHDWHARNEMERAAQRPDDLGPSAASVRTRAMLGDVAAGATISERLAKRLLADYGVEVVNEELTHSADAAASVANVLGYPVVIKVESASIPHKTEAGVVRLSLSDESAVRSAYAEIMDNALRHALAEQIDGVLVQPMLRGGLEVLVGGRVDPDFGPMVVVGLGGVLVELLRDTLTAIAPVSPADARTMLDRLRGRKLFDGFRGSEPVDMDRLSTTVSRVSHFLADNADLLSEVDVNPLICAGSRIVAVDALIVRANHSTPSKDQQ